MTALVFLMGIVTVYVAIPNGYYQLSFGTVYQYAYFATTLSACGWAVYSRDRMAIASALILLGYAILANASWHSYDPELSLALLNLGIAAWFVFLGRRPWEYVCGAIFLVSVFVGISTEYEFITDASRRPALIIAWSHPDITAILGHLAAVTLGAASGDSGKRIRSALAGRPVADSLASRGIAYFRSRYKNRPKLF